MNPPFLSLFAVFFMAGLTQTAGSERASTSYKVAAESTDLGGGRSSSVNYTSGGSAGTIAGVSGVAGPAEVMKAGYLGQLYEVAALVVSAAQPAINEGNQLQLTARQFLDDSTFLPLEASAVTWSSPVAQIVAVSSAGLATAGLVFQDTTGTVEGSFAGSTGVLNLTVFNVAADDFGTYAGDGIDDGWQVQHFGLDNPSAAPGVDADHDGQDNLGEWVADLVPTDPSSVFRLRIERSVPGTTLVFGPVTAGRAYAVKYGFGLSSQSNWPTLGTVIATQSGPELRILDPDSAASLKKFYSVEVTKP